VLGIGGRGSGVGNWGAGSVACLIRLAAVSYASVAPLRRFASPLLPLPLSLLPPNLPEAQQLQQRWVYLQRLGLRPMDEAQRLIAVGQPKSSAKADGDRGKTRSVPLHRL